MSVRLDTANRSFLLLLVLVVAASIVIGFLGCCVIGVVIYRVSTRGTHALTAPGTVPALVLIALLAVGAVRANRVLRRQLIATGRLGRRVRRLTIEPLPARLSQAAVGAGLAGRVDLVDAAESCSFTWGYLCPRVAVSRGLLETVDDAGLDAVLAHERYHVINLDPAKVFLTRVLPLYLPVLGDLHHRYLAGRELAADRRAVEANGRKPLAGALYKVVAGPEWADLDAAAAIGGDEALEARVSQLENGVEPPMRPLHRGRLATSALGGGTLVWSVSATLAAFGGPGQLMRTICTR
ncbi:MAG: M56 family metallopeptidase [Actinobacteria bacterium]|nr:MAG: M56 family metallopeptidase [Actinomycetota bacterium]